MTQQSARLIRAGGEDGAPPLVFIHGFGADHLTWSFMAPAFFNTHCVWTMDLPGHGTASDEIGDGSVEALADRVWQVLDSEAAVNKPMTLVGHSLGGAIALDLQQKCAADVKRLVLLAPSGLVALHNAHLITRLPSLNTIEAATQHLLDLVEVKRLITRPLAEYLLSSLARPQRRAALSKIADALIARDQLVSSVPANTVMIWGEQDRIFPPDLLDQSKLGGQLHQLPGIGHLLQAEAAQKIARLIGGELEADGNGQT